MKYLKSTAMINIGIIFLISMVFTLFLTGNNLKAKFGIIDDHEIFSFLEEEKKVYFKEFPRLLSVTEIGRFGKTTRYRPTYYILRLVETKFWGDNPMLWYGFRIIILTLSITILWFLINKLVGKITSTFFIMHIMSFSYWADIWNRLGPGETYAVLGLAFYSLGFYFLLKKVKAKKIETVIFWLILSLGFIISVGSKENFLFLIIPTLYLWIKTIKEKKFPLVFLITILLSYSGWITTSIYLGLKNSGTDVYGNQVSLVNRTIDIFYNQIFNNKYLMVFILGITVLGLILSYYDFKIKTLTNNLKKAKNYWLWMIAIFGIAISQMIFYGVNFPIGSRYDFPFMICLSIFILLGYLFISQLPIISRIKWFKSLLWLLLMVILFSHIAKSQYNYIRSSSKDNMLRTTIFYNKIILLNEKLTNNPEVPLVFLANNFKQYEPIASVHRYLYHMDVKNDLYLDYSEDDKQSGFNASLSALLMRISKEGGKGDKWLFIPIENLEESAVCYVIIFGSSQNINQCEVIANF